MWPGHTCGDNTVPVMGKPWPCGADHGASLSSKQMPFGMLPGTDLTIHSQPNAQGGEGASGTNRSHRETVQSYEQSRHTCRWKLHSSCCSWALDRSAARVQRPAGRQRLTPVILATLEFKPQYQKKQNRVQRFCPQPWVLLGGGGRPSRLCLVEGRGHRNPGSSFSLFLFLCFLHAVAIFPVGCSLQVFCHSDRKVTKTAAKTNQLF
jgi:hypothetical protein